jgi:hypothetical protein
MCLSKLLKEINNIKDTSLLCPYSVNYEPVMFYGTGPVPAVVAQWLSTRLIIPRSKVQVTPPALPPGEKNDEKQILRIPTQWPVQ